MDTPTIAGEGSSSGYAGEAAKQRAEEEQSKAHPVSVNGHKLTVGDLYSSHYDRKDFISKLNLLEAGKGKSGNGNASPSASNVKPGPSDNDEDDTGEPDMAPIEDQLFGGAKGGKSSKP